MAPIKCKAQVVFCLNLMHTLRSLCLQASSHLHAWLPSSVAAKCSRLQLPPLMA